MYVYKLPYESSDLNIKVITVNGDKIFLDQLQICYVKHRKYFMKMIPIRDISFKTYNVIVFTNLHEAFDSLERW